MLAVIPFCGFYESTHDDLLDRTLEQGLSTACGDPRHDLVYKAFDVINWRAVHIAYAQAYVKVFADEFRLKSMKFDELKSPREYNFGTDRIFVDISEEDVLHMLKATPRETLDEVAAEEFTSRSGFMSFYSPNVSSWAEPSKWDHNQVYALIKAYVRFCWEKDMSCWDEMDLMEDLRCNSGIDEMLFSGLDEAAKCKLNRLYNVNYYLNQRETRK